MKKSIVISGVSLLLCFGGCLGPAGESAIDPKAVEAQIRMVASNHTAALDAKDVEGILQFYAEDGIMIMPGEPIKYGNAWIRNYLEDLFKTHELHETIAFIDIRIIADRVAASYRFEQQVIPLDGGSMVIQRGKGLCILKRSNTNSWQFEWNAYSYDNPVGGE